MKVKKVKKTDAITKKTILNKKVHYFKSTFDKNTSHKE